ncbi:unnamed protein product [Paramecium primaurelia]|uniref:Uncharacterized protein n=1 Tax=Paramecium primaurelia TaxID=5886 RepID=A0A8S1PSE8_PARPR|nr:unnamed protein product [Paramecium primaurelia]
MVLIKYNQMKEWWFLMKLQNLNKRCIDILIGSIAEFIWGRHKIRFWQQLTQIIILLTKLRRSNVYYVEFKLGFSIFWMSRQINQRVDFNQNKLTYWYLLDKHNYYVNQLSYHVRKKRSLNSNILLQQMKFIVFSVFIINQYLIDQLNLSYQLFIYKLFIQDLGFKVKFIQESQFFLGDWLQMKRQVIEYDQIKQRLKFQDELVKEAMMYQIRLPL